MPVPLKMRVRSRSGRCSPESWALGCTTSPPIGNGSPTTTPTSRNCGRGPRHPRWPAARDPGRAVHVEGAGDSSVDGCDVRGSGHSTGAGDRPVGQLLQPGVVRTGDRSAVGARNRRRTPRRESGHRRALRGRNDVSPHVPLRIAVEPRARCSRCCTSTAGGVPAGGSLMGLFIAFYGVGRFWVEGLRVDPADDVGPFRWNQWVALAASSVGWRCSSSSVGIPTSLHRPVSTTRFCSTGIPTGRTIRSMSETIRTMVMGPTGLLTARTPRTLESRTTSSTGKPSGESRVRSSTFEVASRCVDRLQGSGRIRHPRWLRPQRRPGHEFSARVGNHVSGEVLGER